MVLRALICALALAATPVLAQEAASSASTAPDAALSAQPSSVAPPAPAGLDDAGLELAVRSAYTGAAAFAAAHGNYFARDGVVPPLRDAVAAQLQKDGVVAAVPAVAFDDIAAAKACLLTPGTELRILTNIYGDGLTLVAVTATRAFAYAYDPHKAPDIVVTPAEDCAKPR